MFRVDHSLITYGCLMDAEIQAGPPECELCRNAAMTVKHILMDCNPLARQRRMWFGVNNVILREMLGRNIDRRVYNFVKNIGLYDRVYSFTMNNSTLSLYTFVWQECSIEKFIIWFCCKGARLDFEPSCRFWRGWAWPLNKEGTGTYGHPSLTFDFCPVQLDVATCVFVRFLWTIFDYSHAGTVPFIRNNFYLVFCLWYDQGRHYGGAFWFSGGIAETKTMDFSVSCSSS